MLPAQVKHLLLITALKLQAEKLGIVKISAGEKQGKLDFKENPAINPAALIHLIQVHAKNYQMEGPQKLRFNLQGVTPEERIAEIG